MRCKYCYASFGKYDENESSSRIGCFSEYIDVLCRLGVREIGEIMFFGGEPMLAPNIIDSVCRHVNSLMNSHILISIPKYTMISNLTELNKEMVKIIKRNNIHIIMSIDGPDVVNDSLRVEVDGSGTFCKIKSNWLQIKDYVQNVEATFTRIHAEHGFTFDSLRVWLSEEFSLPVENCFVVPVYDCPDYEIPSDFHIDFGCDDIFDEDDGEIFEIIRRNATMNVFCTAGYSSLCILPNGDMYHCHMYAIDNYFLLGNIMDLDNVDCVVDKLHLLDSIKKTEWAACLDCWARRICHFCPALIVCGHHESLLVNNNACQRRKLSFDNTFRKIISLT